MVLKRWLSALLLLLFASACAPLPSTVASFSLPGTDGTAHVVDGTHPTVLVFFSEHCPCMRAHDPRLIALGDEYSPRNVRFFAVDSEVGASVASDEAHARERGYPFPILVDGGAHIARLLGAEYATYTVILDPRGNVLYRGGFDSDHTHLSPRSTPYVREALDDIVAGRPVRHPRTDALGCALQTW